MRNHCLRSFVVLILVGSFVGCGGAGSTSSVPPDVAQQQSKDATKRPMTSAGAAQPNSAMPASYGDSYPTGASSYQGTGGQGSAPTGGTQQPGR